MSAGNNNGRPRSAVQGHPHGPRMTDDGRLIVAGARPDAPADVAAVLAMLVVKLDVLAVGLDALVTVEQRNGEQLVALVAGVAAIGSKLDDLGAKLDGIKLPAFLTSRR